MARYRVDFFCDECFETHSMGITLPLDDGPADMASIEDTYHGKPLPPQLATLTNNTLWCPVKETETVQKDNDQVFLVPIGD